METKYPIVLVHGVLLKNFGPLRAWGSIEKMLKKQGLSVFASNQDGFGTVENNAPQLKAYIERVLSVTSAEKVNIVAHSKGGLDTLYMIEHLGMKEKIASITFIATPHRGAPFANFLCALPGIVRAPVALAINLLWRLLRDKKPDSLAVGRFLRVTDADLVPLSTPAVLDGIYLQSYSSTLRHGIDDPIMSIPLLVSRVTKHTPSDGMVPLASTAYAGEHGEYSEGSLSHSEIAGFMLKPWKKKKVHRFYVSVAEKLAARGL